MPPKSKPGTEGAQTRHITWPERVATSNGTLFMLPENLHEKMKNWTESKKKFDELLNQAAEVEVNQAFLMQGILLEARKALMERGATNVYTKDIGFEENALKEGQFVVSLTQPMGR